MFEQSLFLWGRTFLWNDGQDLSHCLKVQKWNANALWSPAFLQVFKKADGKWKHYIIKHNQLSFSTLPTCKMVIGAVLLWLNLCFLTNSSYWLHSIFSSLSFKLSVGVEAFKCEWQYIMNTFTTVEEALASRSIKRSLTLLIKAFGITFVVHWKLKNEHLNH